MDTIKHLEDQIRATIERPGMYAPQVQTLEGVLFALISVWCRCHGISGEEQMAKRGRLRRTLGPELGSLTESGYFRDKYPNMIQVMDEPEVLSYYEKYVEAMTGICVERK